jgi:hypothetical protein
MANSIGDGVFGLTADETGIVTSAVKFSYSHDEAELVNYQNEVSGVTLSKEKVEISISGKIPATSAFTGQLGSALTLINDMPDHLQGSISAGTTYISSIDIDKENSDYNGIEVKATYRPSLISA